MIYLIRHASAGSRGSNPAASDLERPLDAHGLDRAEAIAHELADAGITYVASSPAVRCVQTVGPLARFVGTTVVEDAALLEGRSAEAAVHGIRRLAQAGVTAALCSHGDIIPDAIQTLAREGVVLVGPRGWAKGSIWTLTTRGQDVVSASFTGPF
ncbi:MAG: histidine phosphatase family protein [Acidimicrobiales bacterium]|nr:histidine phosphatase family protein [Acidimicrobiales bacterium]